MRKSSNLYIIGHRDENQCISVGNRWWREQVGKSFCKHCDRVLPSIYPNPVDAVLPRHPTKISNGILAPTTLGIISRSLWLELFDWIKYFAVGKCFHESGYNITEYHTYYGVEPLLVRGDPDSRYWRCKVCGQINGAPRAPQFVLASDLQRGREVYHDSIYKLLISERVHRTIDWSKYPDLWLIPIPIIDLPPQGCEGELQIEVG